MTSSSPESSYKIITKQIFIPQETLHRVLIFSFADRKTKPKTTHCEGSTWVWTGEHISKWGADWWLEVGKPFPAPSAPSTLRAPSKHPGNSSCNVSIKRKSVSADFYKPRSNILSKWRWIASAESQSWEVERHQIGCRHKVKCYFKLYSVRYTF